MFMKDHVTKQARRAKAASRILACIPAEVRNKALLAMGAKQQFQMTWFERHIGIYCPWVKYDDHARLVNIE